MAPPAQRLTNSELQALLTRLEALNTQLRSIVTSIAAREKTPDVTALLIGMIEELRMMHKKLSTGRAGKDGQRLLKESKSLLRGCQESSRGALKLHADMKPEDKRRAVGQKAFQKP